MNKRTPEMEAVSVSLWTALLRLQYHGLNSAEEVRAAIEAFVDQKLVERSSGPAHPTYGTLDQFLAELRREIVTGQGWRIGHHGAVGWFTSEYAKRAENPTSAL